MLSLMLLDDCEVPAMQRQDPEEVPSPTHKSAEMPWMREARTALMRIDDIAKSAAEQITLLARLLFAIGSVPCIIKGSGHGPRWRLPDGTRARVSTSIARARLREAVVPLARIGSSLVLSARDWFRTCALGRVGLWITNEPALGVAVDAMGWTTTQLAIAFHFTKEEFRQIVFDALERNQRVSSRKLRLAIAAKATPQAVHSHLPAANENLHINAENGQRASAVDEAAIMLAAALNASAPALDDAQTDVVRARAAVDAMEAHADALASGQSHSGAVAMLAVPVTVTRLPVSAPLAT